MRYGNKLTPVIMKTQIYNRTKRIIKALLGYIIPRKYTIWQGSLFAKRVALTFDDGPNGQFTEKVLAVLNSHNIKATFFLLGEELEKNPHLAKHIVEQGHEVGNHLYRHRHIPQMEVSDFLEELGVAQRKIDGLLKNELKLFRPPYGQINFKALISAVKLGYTSVMFSIDSKDWQYRNAPEIINEINHQKIMSGDIILFHDNNEGTIAALPDIIADLKGRGFKLVTLSELINQKTR